MRVLAGAPLCYKCFFEAYFDQLGFERKVRRRRGPGS
jgi:hypothetical protein